MGICVGGDDAYLVLRGMRTMGIRIERQQKSAMVICQWLNKHPQVDKVLYPALPSDPGYKLWKRDFGGATGLFSFVIKNGTEKHGEKFLNALKLHGLGYSWAGYESLAVMPDFLDRTIAHPPKGGVVIRIQVGLEDTEDIINDLKLGFNAIQNTK